MKKNLVQYVFNNPFIGSGYLTDHYVIQFDAYYSNFFSKISTFNLKSEFQSNLLEIQTRQFDLWIIFIRVEIIFLRILKLKINHSAHNQRIIHVVEHWYNVLFRFNSHPIQPCHSAPEIEKQSNNEDLQYKSTSKRAKITII